MSDPGYLSVLRRNLKLALGQGDLEAARDLLDRLGEEDAFARETRILELEYLWVARRDVDAAALAGQLIELFPDSARVAYLAGRIAYRQRHYEAAVEHYQESDRIAPRALTRHLLGKALTQAGRLDQAEAVLLALAEERPQVLKDLAWLEERRFRYQRALEYLQRYREHAPTDRWIEPQVLRLQARLADPEAVEDEVTNLLALGEEVPAELFVVHCEALLAAGRENELALALESPEARDPLVGRRIGWAAYKAGRYALAFDLFARGFADDLANPKFLSAFEKAARVSGRIGELVVLYRGHAARAPQLYGRLRRLEPAPSPDGTSN